MNNCPKCGNPLQAGVTSCPICGTNISVENEAKQVTVESVAQTPVAETVKPEEKPAAKPAVVESPAGDLETKTQMMYAESAATEKKEEIKEEVVEATPVPVATPAPVETQAPVTPVVPETQASVVTQAPAATQAPVEAQVPVSSEMPAIEPTPVATQAPVIEPTPVVTQAPITPSAQTPVVDAPVEKEKPKKKKNVLLPVLVILLLVVAGAAVYLNFFSGTSKVQQQIQPTQKSVETATKEVIANGFDFKIVDGWIVREDNNNVIINNENETVIIKITHTNKNIEALTEDGIKNYFTNRGLFENIEVKSNKINAKETIVVDGVQDGKPFQVYFIDGGTDLMLGVMVVYAGKEESKTVNEAAVQELIGSISYSISGNETININNTYSDIFGSFNGAIVNDNSNIPEPENPSEEPQEPEIVPENQNTEDNN